MFKGGATGRNPSDRRAPALTPAIMHMATGRLGRAALSWSAGAVAPPYPETEPEIAALDTDVSAFDLAKLDRFPLGSFGYACAAFVIANRLRPLAATGPLNTADPARKLAIRRILLHDPLHVLLGFRADLPGELGVFSFVAEQHYSPVFEKAAREMAKAYLTIAPWLRDELEAAEARGRDLAAAAPRLLTMPLEREWSAILAKLQARLNLKTWRKLTPATWPEGNGAGDVG